ncbi:LytR/AlgR family response regulator transcription factor [Sphingobacterium thalpophilum]|uniref:LytR/AlgR family response regulator transcription factor n=1 Tax=Sphingobacterium thalpophilum TaxID=259 RepID=UPI003D9761ED
MELIKCIIVDDEINSIQNLERLIKPIPQLEVVGTFLNATEAISFVEKNEVYLVFLDINMSDFSGFEAAKRLPDKKIIFTTGFASYALDSYSLENVVDYLLKPILFGDLTRAVKKANKLFVVENHFYLLNNDLYLAYRENGIDRKISFTSISHIETKNNYSLVYLENRVITVPIPLWELERTLPESKFIRINKSTVVNLTKVIDDDNTKHLVMIGGKKLIFTGPYRRKNAEKIIDSP